MRPGPDFIVIGAMKCATSTLHEQLARQPGFFMSEPKEPNFFSDDAAYARGLESYRALFAGAARGDRCGESSTHYTKLPTYPDTVARIRRHLPSVKLVYVMRDPMRRLESQYVHEWTMNVVSGALDRAVRSHPELVDYGRYAMQLRPYLEAFGAERILPVFMERLTAHPQAELERVCDFLGYAGCPTWRPEVARRNASQERLRESPLRDRVLEAPLLKQARRRFVPQALRDRIKRLWQMRERPELSQAERARIQAIYDRDLATLGRWLGLELACQGFGERVREVVPEWSAAVRRGEL